MGLGELNRTVTAQDVEDGKTIRALQVRIPNPLALNMYVLGYDGDKKLVETNSACKKNLQNYLSQYRMMTDSVNIKNGYVINLGIDFEVVVLAGFNSRTVVLQCIDKLKTLFHF